MLNVIIFGPPGCGKGTQSKLLARRFHLTHVSTGDLLRHEIRKESDVGKKVKPFVDNGLLVPDKIVMRKLYHEILKHSDTRGFVFDGFPRSVLQANALDKFMNIYKVELLLVIAIWVEKEELFRRMMGRAEDSGRSDDNEQIIDKRLQVYHLRTKPILDHYQQQNKLFFVSGMAPVREVAGKIASLVESKLP
ncbi:MAG: adenylate kinase [Bacteroidales bacterium]